MSMDLSTTLGYDIARRSGEEVLHQTLSKGGKAVEKAIMEDVANLLNQAGASGATVKETVPIARLVGYLNELAMAFGVMAKCGDFSFTSAKQLDGTRVLQVSFKPAKGKA
jgi:hypothetical protein